MKFFHGLKSFSWLTNGTAWSYNEIRVNSGIGGTGGNDGIDGNVTTACVPPAVAAGVPPAAGVAAGAAPNTDAVCAGATAGAAAIVTGVIAGAAIVGAGIAGTGGATGTDGTAGVILAIDILVEIDTAGVAVDGIAGAAGTPAVVVSVGVTTVPTGAAVTAGVCGKVTTGTGTCQSELLFVPLCAQALVAIAIRNTLKIKVLVIENFTWFISFEPPA